MSMESSRGRWGWNGRSMLKLAFLCFVLVAVIISLCCVCFLACSSSGCRGSSVLHLDFRRLRAAAASCTDQDCSGRRRPRRLFEGPGSYPPRCASKCGDCNPCYPVHVAVPPGVPVTTEYYPEAWRCKCGNRLYMP